MVLTTDAADSQHSALYKGKTISINIQTNHCHHKCTHTLPVWHQFLSNRNS